MSSDVDESGPVCSLAAGGRVPDFFIAGHPKSGTTALYEMLRRHPQIFMSEEKEPWYFSPELRHRPPPRKPFAIPETLELYLSLFAAAGPGQLAGEASTTYLWSRAAAGMIAEAQPDARIIAILREPASFLRSLHLQFVEAHIETEGDLRRALALEAATDARAGTSRVIPTGRSCCSTPSTCATWSSCAATTRCSRPSRCWC